MVVAWQQPVSAENNRFPPIGSYGFLSDCHTAALVSFSGSVEWLCCPRFDSPSTFAALLDRVAGHMILRPQGVIVPIGRRYSPGTLVIETTWVTDTGWVVVKDALTIADWVPADGDPDSRRGRPETNHESDRSLLRTMTCIDGEVEMEMEGLPRFGYGVEGAEWSGGELGEAVASSGDGTELLLTSDMHLQIEGGAARGKVTLKEDQTAFCALTWSDGELGGPRSAPEALERIDSTEEFWREWLRDGQFPDHPWRIHLQRSALVLKGLTYTPTGAIVAAPTTSLPEAPGGVRNWDYRFSWMRDATFTLSGLHSLGLNWEADDFIQFVADLGRNEDGALQIMYGIGGERVLEEETLDHLTGYEGARPVRVGNDAYRQRQNDVFGAVLDSLWLHAKEYGHNSARLWPVIHDQVEQAIASWRLPDQGIWESRGDPQHSLPSKLMCWVALDRGARLAARRGKDDLADRWRLVANEIPAEILERGVDENGVFTQHYDTTALDASLLLLPLVRFLPHDDARVRATVLAIADELTENGLVLRYRTDETDDGVGGEEGSFLICSFWLVSALLEIGDRARGRQLCERLLSLASPLDLYAEELDAATGRHLGNYPQAFTHLALINAVMHVIRDEQQNPAG